MSYSDQFNIRWNNYSVAVQNVFNRLLLGEQFVDVTLACEGKSIKCHRLILSACSTYFETLLRDNPQPNLVIYLKDMKYWELQALVTFMYNGEVSISQKKLPLLCKAAEDLKVKGLANETEEDEEDGGNSEVEEFQEIHSEQDASAQFGFASAETPTMTKRSDNVQDQVGSYKIKRKFLSEPPKLLKLQKHDNEKFISLKCDKTFSAKVGTVKNEDNGLPNPNNDEGRLEENLQESKLKPRQSEHDTESQESFESFTNFRINADTKDIQKSRLMCLDEEGGSEMDDDTQGNDACSTSKLPLPPGVHPKKIRVIRKHKVEVLTDAAVCILEGMTFQQVSERFDVPKTTLRDFMVRRGLLQRGGSKKQGDSSEELPVPATSLTKI